MHKAALTQAQFPPVLDSKRLELAGGSDKDLEAFAASVFSRLQTAKSLDKVTFPQPQNAPEWLISETAYEVSYKVGNKGTKQICMVALDEASPPVLSARERLLKTYEVMSLRRNVWLGINRELKANPTTVIGIPRKFRYWDQVPDSLETCAVGKGLYSEEVAVEVGRCFEEDSQDLKKLGDFLVTCRALVNNRDAPTKDRVIEEKTKKLVDRLLTVRT